MAQLNQFEVDASELADKICAALSGASGELGTVAILLVLDRALSLTIDKGVPVPREMLSDLTKHVGTREHPGRELAPMFYGSRNPAEVRRWIEGFN